MIEPFIPSFLQQPGVHKLHPLLVTEIDGARLLGISRAQMKRLIAEGEVVVVEIGKEARITVASIEAYVVRLGAGKREVRRHPG